MEFQNTRFKPAECEMKLEAMQAFVNRVGKILLSDQLVSALASMEMLWASETQGEIIDERLQLHGDYAFMLEYPIARLYTDCRVQRIYGGTSEIQ